jgi:aromatic ring hydroxylase
MDLFPDKESEIQKYLKSNKVNYEEKTDILKFADFLSGL